MMKLKPSDNNQSEPDRADAAERRDDAVGVLYRDERPRLLRYFLQKIGNLADADDLTQETITRYLCSPSSSRIAAPRGYLLRIAANLLKRKATSFSSKLSMASVPFDENLHMSPDIDPHRLVEDRMELERWKGILLKLPPRTLEIFLLNRLDGLSYLDIAQRQNIPFWVVKKQMLKAIRHLAVHQEQDHG